MTITDGEIVALTLVIAVVAVGTVIICFRCWKSISKAETEAKKAASLHHTNDKGFHFSYVETFRRSFRNFSFRRSGSRRKRTDVSSTTGAARVHVATVDDLIKETSDIHPSYLEKKETRNPESVNVEVEDSPHEAQSEYHRLDEDDEVENQREIEASIHGIENPVYSAKEQLDQTVEDDVNLGHDAKETPTDLGPVSSCPDEDTGPENSPFEAGHEKPCPSNTKIVKAGSNGKQLISEQKYKNSFPSAHFTHQTPNVDITLSVDKQASSTLAHMAQHKPNLDIVGERKRLEESLLAMEKPGDTDTLAYKALYEGGNNVSTSKDEQKQVYSDDSYI